MRSTHILPAASKHTSSYFSFLFLFLFFFFRYFERPKRFRQPWLHCSFSLKDVHFSLPCAGHGIFFFTCSLISFMIWGNLNSKHWKEKLAICYLIFNPSFPLCTFCLGSYVFQKHKGNSSANLSTSHSSVMSALHLFCYVTMHRMFDADVLTQVVEQNEICCFLTTPPSRDLFKQQNLA